VTHADLSDYYLDPTQHRVSVPQRSVLGPKNALNTPKIGRMSSVSAILYADDTQLVKRFRLTEILAIIDTLQRRSLHNWCA